MCGPRCPVGDTLGLWDDFKTFATRGNVIDMAVGIVIGTTFGAVIKSLVDDMLMPPVGLLLGDTDMADLFVVLKQGTPAGPYATLEAAKQAGAVTWRYGLFLNSVVTFLIVALLMFLLIRWIVERVQSDEAVEESPTTRICPYCRSAISLEASRCPNCTSEVEPDAGEAAPA